MKNVFLIGFMGVGKTTFGKKLAAALGLEFVDMDEAIELMEKKTVSEIFESMGEARFRELEQHWLKNFEQHGKLVATGGGAPCFGNALELMNDKGITIYLQRPAAELTHRLFHAQKKRPLLKDRSKDELLAYVSDVLRQRELFYEQADIILDRNQQTVEQAKKSLSTLKKK